MSAIGSPLLARKPGILGTREPDARLDTWEKLPSLVVGDERGGVFALALAGCAVGVL